LELAVFSKYTTPGGGFGRNREFKVGRAAGGVQSQFFSNPSGKTRDSQSPPAEHEMDARRLFLAGPKILDRPDFSIGDDRDRKTPGNATDRFPIGGWGVALGFGSSVDGDPRSASRLHSLRILVNSLGVVESQAEFGADGKVGRHHITDRPDDVFDALWKAEQGGPSVISIHGGCGAAEIDVDPESSG
jgi:hypothetical protein